MAIEKTNISNYVLNEVKFWQGTQNEYNALIANDTVNKDTIYFVLAESNEGGNTIHLGNELMDDSLYEKIGNGVGGVDKEEILKILNKYLEPINSEITSLNVDVDNLNQSLTNIEGSIVETVIQVVEEQFGEIIETIIDEKVSVMVEPIIQEKVDAVLGNITTDLEYTKNKVDSIDKFSTVFSPSVNTTNRLYNPLSSQYISGSTSNVEIGLEVHSDIYWNLNKVGSYTMPTRVTSSEPSWTDTPINDIPISPNKSETITKVFKYNESMSSARVSFIGKEMGYKVENSLIKYVENEVTKSASSALPTWGNRWYKGVLKSKSVTGDDIKNASIGTIVANNNTALKTLDTGKISNVGKDDYYFIAYPASAGVLTVISLNGVQDITGAFELITVPLINAYGISQIYNIYVSVFSGAIADGSVLTTK